MSKSKLALDVVSSLRSLANSIEDLVGALETDGNDLVKGCQVNAKETQAEESKSVETKQPTLEEVRAVLAAKNKAGHREVVKSVILKYGANKLTTLDPAHYAQVLEEVGVLN